MDTSDSSLVQHFLDGTAEEPFRRLVERYQNLVFSAALRRTGERGRAEEVAQDVFVLLAERARELVRHPNLAGWLYKTTLKKAANRMKSETRRVAREKRFSEEALLAGEEEIPPAAFSLVDEALGHLGEKDREALVLRFFQDLELGEVGRAQGSSAEAARKRVTRALGKLGEIFRGNGVALPSTAVVATVLGQSTQCAPAGLLPAVTAAATVPAVPSVFATIITSIITMSKTQTTILVILLAAIPLGVQQAVLEGLKGEREELKRELVQNRRATEIRGADPSPAVAGTGGAAKGESEKTPMDSLLEEWTSDEFKKRQLSIQQASTKAQVAKLVSDLGLDEELAKRLESHALENVMEETRRQEEQMKKLAAASSDKERLEAWKRSDTIEPLDGIAQFLTEEQVGAYEEWVEAREEAQLREVYETMAYEELGDLQQVLRLTPEQKDRAFDVFMEEWSKPEEAATAEEPDRKGESREELALRLEQEIQERLENLSAFLADDQIRVYREHLREELGLELPTKDQ